MEIARLAIEKATMLGATEAEAYVQSARTIRIAFDEEVRDIRTVESTGLGLRVALGKRTAMYSTSVLDEAEIDGAVEKAVKVAKVAPEDPHWGHMNRDYGKSSAEGYYDRATANLGCDEMMEGLGSAISVLNERNMRAKPTRGYLSLMTSEVSLVNSHGEAVGGKETFATAWMRVKATEAGLESTGSEYQLTRSFRKIDLDSMAEKAVDKAVSFLGAKPVQTGEMPVILENRVAAGIMGWILNHPIRADVVQSGGSHLADRLGERIASKDIEVFDDGTMAGGVSTRPFDGEGHLTQRTPVVEGGVLRGLLYDSYTALKDGVDSTGNATRVGLSYNRARAYSSPPTLAPTNLVLGEGSASVDEVIRDTKHGLYVEQTIGEYMSDPISGNINATVTHGHVVEDGELGAPVKGVVLTGSYHEQLRDGFEAIANDTDFYVTLSGMGFYSPTVKLRRLTVAGM